MDPNACLVRLLIACLEDDADTAAEAAADLAQWLNRGGFCPQVLYTARPYTFTVPRKRT